MICRMYIQEEHLFFLLQSHVFSNHKTASDTNIRWYRRRIQAKPGVFQQEGDSIEESDEQAGYAGTDRVNYWIRGTLVGSSRLTIGIRNDFRERSDLNPHTMSHIRETAATTTTTAPATTHTRNMSAANALKNEYYSQTAQASSSSASAATAQNTSKTHPSSNPRESISVLSFDQSPVLQK